MTNVPHATAELALVIPLAPGRRADHTDEPPGRDTPAPEASGPELDHALEVLARRGGPRAIDVPADLGRPALLAQQLLEDGPTRARPAVDAPGRIINLARRLLLSVEALEDLVREEGGVLAEALQVDLDDLTLAELDRVAEAVVALSTAPTPVPGWATPAAAAAADVVLAAGAPDLQEAAAAHQRLYGAYTDSVWDVPPQLLARGRHWYRPVASVRLRRALRSVSRTGRLPARLRAAAGEVLDARAARARVDALAPLLAHHLGRLDRGVFTDVDGARRALAALQALQSALGDRLDTGRLERLVLADAFRSYEVVAPASRIHAAVRAWAADAERCGADALECTLEELVAWAGDCDAALQRLATGAKAAQDLDMSLPTLAALVDLLVLREHVEDVRIELAAAAARAGSAS